MVRLAGKRVLVTGGAGLIGGFLVPRLLKGGARVRVVDFVRQPGNLKSCLDQIEYKQGDLRREQVASKAIKDMDVVYHLAAKIGNTVETKAHELDMGQTNIEIDYRLLKAIEREEVPYFQYASTAGVYDGSSNLRIPTRESDAWKGEPTSLYGEAKLLGERQTLLISEKTKAMVAITRLFSVYGEGEDYGETGRVIPHLIRKVLLKEPYRIWGDGNQVRTFLHASDASAALISVVENIEKVNRIPLNVGHERAVTIRDLARLVQELGPYPYRPKPEFDPSMTSGAYAMVPDLSLITKLTNWKPAISLEDGLGRMFAWYEKVYHSRNHSQLRTYGKA